MRKRMIQHNRDASSLSQQWLDVEHLAQVEITSEDPARPIEAALLPGTPPGWRAAHPGKQVIRLVFVEEQHERTQEFVVRWSADGGQSYREIVRQQYTFGPPGTREEVEHYHVPLDGVTHLEISLVPDIQGGPACATLEELRLL